MSEKTIAFESLTVSSINQARREVLDALGAGSGVLIPLDGLESIDLSGVQLLVAAVQACRGVGRDDWAFRGTFRGGPGSADHDWALRIAAR
jgi:anti-anti-sigma regulatory factor